MRLLPVHLLGILFTLLPLGRNGAAAEAKAPNILLILIDDMGWKDLGCYGSDFYQTPHIDQFASEGMRFTDAYAAASVCSPTRASIVTGKYPARIRMTDWIPGNRPKDKPLIGPAFQRWLPGEETTIGELLQKNGYRTAWIGKWHLRGLPTKEHPDPAKQDPRYAKPQQDHGFEVGVQDWHLNQDMRPDDPKGVLALTEETMEFIKDTPDRPWFVALSHYSVHTPIRFNEEVHAAYKARLKPETRQRNPQYAAMVDALDRSIGTLMAFLSERKLDENTLIVFTSDNGGLGGATNNSPLRSGKGTLYEGGTRVPFIARWPGRIPAGETSGTMVSTIDLYPTFAGFAGVNELPEDIDGIDLGDHFRSGKQVARDTLFWHYPHYHYGAPGGSIRKGNHKLIEYFEDGKLELYHIGNDIGESTNLVGSEPELAKQLHEELKAWRHDLNAQMPSPNPAYTPKAK